MRESLMFWIVVFVLAIAFVFVIGGLFSLAFVGWRGYSIYNRRFGKEQEEDEDNEQGEAPQPGSATQAATSQFKEQDPQDKKENESERKILQTSETDIKQEEVKEGGEVEERITHTQTQQ